MFVKYISYIFFIDIYILLSNFCNKQVIFVSVKHKPEEN